MAANYSTIEQALEELRAFGLPKATVHANNRKLS